MKGKRPFPLCEMRIVPIKCIMHPRRVNSPKVCFLEVWGASGWCYFVFWM